MELNFFNDSSQSQQSQIISNWYWWNFEREIYFIRQVRVCCQVWFGLLQRNLRVGLTWFTFIHSFTNALPPINIFFYNKDKTYRNCTFTGPHNGFPDILGTIGFFFHCQFWHFPVSIIFFKIIFDFFQFDWIWMKNCFNNYKKIIFDF